MGSPVSKARRTELKINQAHHWPEAEWFPLAGVLQSDSLRGGEKEEGTNE